MQASPRAVLLALACLLASACSSDKAVRGVEPTAVATEQTRGGGATPSISPTPGTGGAAGAAPGARPIPADITRDIDGILRAATPAEAVRATRIVLERSGVSVRAANEPYRPSASGLSFIEADVVAMTLEAQGRATRSRLTFAELAQGLSVISRLPAPDAPAPAPDATAYEYRGQDVQWVHFLNEWVAAATTFHDPNNTRTQPVTSAPLYLTALGLEQRDPVDLRSPFLPHELRMGTLDVVLLLAGLRTSLRVVDRAAFPVPRGSGLLEGATSQVPSNGPSDGTLPVVWFTQAPSAECEALKRTLSGNQQAAVDGSGTVAGEALEFAIARAFEQLGRNGRGWAQLVGPLFDAAGIIVKWLSLMILYDPDNLQLDLDVNPATVHKPTVPGVIALATLNVKVPDERWRELRRQQAEHPVLNLLKGCARSIGMPVPQDLASIGGAMGGWHVQWDVRQGQPSHVELPGAQFPAGGAGRLETQMETVNDHAGKAELILAVKTERQRDHPGDEVAARIEVCGSVRTDEPPSLQTWLNAGIGGWTREVTTVLVALSDLFAGMVQNAFTLDVCGHGYVTYHVPSAGTWRGKITVQTDRTVSSTAGSSYQGLTTTGTFFDSQLTTDTIFVWTRDDGARRGLVQAIFPMETRQYSHSGHLKRSVQMSVGRGARPSTNRQFMIGCDYTETKSEEAHGTWAFDSDDASVSLTIHEDGRYDLNISPDPGEGHARADIVLTQVYRPGQGRDCRAASSDTQTRSGSASALTWSGRVTGILDRQNPGNTIKGAAFIGRGDTKSVVRWELTHDGPIRIPSRQLAGN